MAALTFTSRTYNQIVLALAAGSGETTFEVEANRASDFASDESLLLTGVAAGAVTFNGLPAETPFFFRARATNTTPKGPWSTVLLQGTAAGTANAPNVYSGFMIAPAIVVVPQPIDQISCAQTDSGSLVDNLLNDDPLSVLRSSANTVTIIFHTSGNPCDVIAVLGTMCNDDATIRVRNASTQANLTSAPSNDSGTQVFRGTSYGIGRRPFYHAFYRLPTPSTNPWWQIDIANGAAQFIARHLVAGLARTSVNASKGMGYQPLDMGSLTRTQFGTPDRVLGWRGRIVDFQMSWLSETEYEAKWSDLEMLVGTTRPVLAIPNSKANAYFNDRIAFGEISSMRGENVAARKWTKNLEVRSLY